MAVAGGFLPAAAGEFLLDACRQPIEAIHASAPGHDSVVDEAMPGIGPPQHLSAVAVEGDQSAAGRLVDEDRGGLFLAFPVARIGRLAAGNVRFLGRLIGFASGRLAAGLLGGVFGSDFRRRLGRFGIRFFGGFFRRLDQVAAEMGETPARQEHVLVDAEVRPLRGSLLTGPAWQLKSLHGRAGLRIEHLARAAGGHVDRVGGRYEIRPAGVGARDVALVADEAQRPVAVRLVEIDAGTAQILELHLPKDAARINVAGVEAVHAFNEQPAADDLLRRTVSVPRQDVEIRVAAEPQEPQRELHAEVVRFQRVGHVAVLVSPPGSPRQRPFADQPKPSFGRLCRRPLDLGSGPSSNRFRGSRPANGNQRLPP